MNTLYQEQLLVSGIMCHQGCGLTIEAILSDLDDLKDKNLVPQDTLINLDAEPAGLGLQRLTITLESEQDIEVASAQITQFFSQQLDDIGFSLENGDAKKQARFAWGNWLNLAISLGAMALILTLGILLPPSLPLTLGLVAITALSSAFAARHHILDFYRNLKKKRINTMATPITLGWAMSVIHVVFHALTMPMMHGLTMLAGTFMMPNLLIATVNAMDEMKRLVMKKATKMQLESLYDLFPEMSACYSCLMQNEALENINLETLNLLTECSIAKGRIKQGMLVRVKQGQCFPVDGVLLSAVTRIDASLLTGETSQLKKLKDIIPAGAINLGDEVLVYANTDSYHSTINQMLFSANRAAEQKPQQKKRDYFPYVYAGLFLLCVTAAFVPIIATGGFALPLVITNLASTLFILCPCTLAIAKQLPEVFNTHRKSQHNIIERNQHAISTQKIETIVFDKTGTLTTGDSTVESSINIDEGLWQRIFLLEQELGRSHPIGKAIINHYQAKFAPPLFSKISNQQLDANHRGITAMVQGRNLHIGNLAFLQDNDITVPAALKKRINPQLEQGLTPICIAEDGECKGVVFIRHQLRPRTIKTLQKLKRQGKRIIMLTGDNQQAAMAFNRQNGFPFELEDIHFAQTPQNKEAFLKTLSKEKGVWFVGDGLNDAPCARVVSDNGGVSCAISNHEKASYFTDMSLNGSIDYLLTHERHQKRAHKTMRQNQGLIAFNSLCFLAFLLAFAIGGLSLNPIIPMLAMTLSTLLVLGNSYRVNLAVDSKLEQAPALWKRMLASDWIVAAVVSATSLVVAAVICQSLVVGALSLPVITFAAGPVMLIGSGLLIAASVAASACVASALVWGVTSHVKEVLVPKLARLPFIAPQKPRFETVPSSCQAQPGLQSQTIAGAEAFDHQEDPKQHHQCCG